MFTGLVEDVGVLAARTLTGKAGKLEVTTALPLAEFRLGDSVAVNGVCLTVESVNIGAKRLVFHTLAETLHRTNFGDKKTGAPVNLERALRVGDRLGGHLVSGHVDTTAKILEIGRSGDDYVVTIELPDALKPLVVPKGSIAVDGISLTLAALAADSFRIHLIPHTWNATALRNATAGDRMNLEADMIGKYILRQHDLAESANGRVSMNTLADAGFL